MGQRETERVRTSTARLGTSVVDLGTLVLDLGLGSGVWLLVG